MSSKISISPATLAVIARDAAGVLAVASIAIGAGMIYLPAGFIVGGAIVLTGVVLVARSG